jgi:hypothetical protein
MNLTFGPPLTAGDVKEVGWYFLDRPGPPRGYVYIAGDPDDNLWLYSVSGKPLKFNNRFIGTFYRVPSDPLEE